MHSLIWHPFTQHAINPNSIYVERASGASLFTREVVGSENGNKAGERRAIDAIGAMGLQNKKEDGEQRIIDAISSWWVITHGHCHPHIVKSVQAQSEKLEQVIFAGFTHEQAEQLAARLVDLTGQCFSECGGAYDYVFFSDSGSTCVEVALKMVIGYWSHRGCARRKIVALEGGYHGDTFGTMSAGARSPYNALYDPYLFDVAHIPVPEAGKEAYALERLETYLNAHKDDVAAFIFEPLLLGAGGMRVYSSEALKQMADMCRAHDVLLIADEVMTGFGRTGTVFACEQAGVKPDLMCLSKGLTGGFLAMGVTLCSHDIYKAFYHKDRAKMFFHSSSFTGNALACAAANASLDIWENEPVQQRIDSICESHQCFAAQAVQHDHLANIRQKGTMLAMDVVANKNSDGDMGADYLSMLQPKLYELSLSRGVLLRPLGNTLYVLPPYCVSGEDLTYVYKVITEIAEEVCDGHS